MGLFFKSQKENDNDTVLALVCKINRYIQKVKEIIQSQGTLCIYSRDVVYYYKLRHELVHLDAHILRYTKENPNVQSLYVPSVGGENELLENWQEAVKNEADRLERQLKAFGLHF